MHCNSICPREEPDENVVAAVHAWPPLVRWEVRKRPLARRTVGFTAEGCQAYHDIHNPCVNMLDVWKGHNSQNITVHLELGVKHI